MASRSTSETGHVKNLGNAQAFISALKSFNGYEPANESLSVSSLAAAHAKAAAVINAENAKEAAYHAKVGERRNAFKEMRSLSTRVGALIISGDNTTAKANARTVLRKIQAASKKAVEPAADASAAVKTHSTAQRSYDNLIGHFRALTAVAAGMDDYRTNVAELKPNALDSRAAELESLNGETSDAVNTLRSVEKDRNSSLYGSNGIVTLCMKAKQQVKAIYGLNSPEYRTASKIQFKTRA